MSASPPFSQSNLADHSVQLAEVEVVDAAADGTVQEDDNIAALEENPAVDITSISDEALQELPEEVLAFLVRSIPSRAAWAWLTDRERDVLLYKATLGFQRNIAALRQPIVRARLAKHLEAQPAALRQWLQLWLDTKPRVWDELNAHGADEPLRAALPDLCRRHGIESVVLALAIGNRRAVLETLDEIIEAALQDNPDAVSGDEAELETAATEPASWGAVASLEAVPGSVEADKLRAQRDEARERLDALQNQMNALQSTLSATREQHGRELRDKTAQIKRETLRANAAETKLHETQKLLDRTARRLKHNEKELEETQVENKRLKRQLRRNQEINEELRKQLAQLQARLEALSPKPEVQYAQSTPPKTTEPKVKSPKVLSPLDQLFVWKSDGRQFRVTPRDVQRAVDRNDEAFVFQLIQAFDALRETNAAGYRLFLDALRQLDRYYSRVLTVDTTRVLIDASNVARYEKDRYGRGQLKHLLSMRDELRRRDCFPIQIIADASLPYNIDEANELLAMRQRGEIEFANAGQEADELLAREARRTGAYVVTNDRGFFLKVTPDFEPPRVTFRILDGFLVVDEF